MSDDWERSAAAWIASQGDDGDFTRRHVLDRVMLGRIAGRGFRRMLDVGCGEGRFCRMAAPHVETTTGVDPAPSLIAEARRLDPKSVYRLGGAEQLDFAEESFDLVVAYLSLIDIEPIEAAIAEIVRVMAPGGTLLIANLNGFNTACAGQGWVKDAFGRKLHYPIDEYLTPRPRRQNWKGISVINWHRPLSLYMTLLIDAGLRLTLFTEPAPIGGDRARADAYRRVPYAHVMEWRRDPADEGAGAA